jgi:serine/threonine protein kinase
MNNIKIKLSDMGGCLTNDKKRHGHIQTCYYRSPEILLELDYGIQSDMWALACTIYELLTGRILFDVNEYDGCVKRHHLYLIIQKMGFIPEEIIDKSYNKDIFFTKNKKMIKGYNSIDYSNSLECILNEISNKNNLDTNTKNLFIDFMTKMFSYNTETRLTSNDALKHNLFKNFI